MLLSSILLQAAAGASLGKLGAAIGAAIAVIGAALGIGKIGAGKFEGLYVCGGTKTNSIATDEECGSSGSVEVGEFGKDS